MASPTRGRNQIMSPVDSEMSFAGEKCDCCPYGHHINLDFLSKINKQRDVSTLQKLKEIHKTKRKLRKSMETYMKDKQDGSEHVSLDSGSSGRQADAEWYLNTIEKERATSKHVLSDFDQARVSATGVGGQSTASEALGTIVNGSIGPPIGVRRSRSHHVNIRELRSPAIGAGESGVENRNYHLSSDESIPSPSPNMNGPYKRSSSTSRAVESAYSRYLGSISPTRALNRYASPVPRFQENEDDAAQKSVPLMQMRISVLQEEKRLMELQLQAQREQLEAAQVASSTLSSTAGHSNLQTRSIGVDTSLSTRPRARSRSPSPYNQMFSSTYRSASGMSSRFVGLQQARHSRRSPSPALSHTGYPSENGMSRSSSGAINPSAEEDIRDSERTQNDFRQIHHLLKSIDSASQADTSEFAAGENEVFTKSARSESRQSHRQMVSEQSSIIKKSVSKQQSTTHSILTAIDAQSSARASKMQDEAFASKADVSISQKKEQSILSVGGASVQYVTPPPVPHKRIRSTGVGDVDVWDNMSGNSMEHSESLRHLSASSSKQASYRSVGVSHKTPTRNVGMGYSCEPARPTTRTIGVNMSMDDAVTLITTEETKHMSMQQLLLYSLQSNVSIDSTKIQQYVQNLLKRDVRCKGTQCKPDVRDNMMNHIDEELELQRTVSTSSVACGDDVVNTRNVFVSVIPETSNACTWTDRKPCRDSSSNTVLAVSRNKSTSTLPAVQYPVATNTDIQIVVHNGTNTENRIFQATNAIRNTAVGTEYASCMDAETSMVDDEEFVNFTKDIYFGDRKIDQLDATTSTDAPAVRSIGTLANQFRTNSKSTGVMAIVRQMHMSTATDKVAKLNKITVVKPADLEEADESVVDAVRVKTDSECNTDASLLMCPTCNCSALDDDMNEESIVTITTLPAPEDGAPRVVITGDGPYSPSGIAESQSTYALPDASTLKPCLKKSRSDPGVPLRKRTGKNIRFAAEVSQGYISSSDEEDAEEGSDTGSFEEATYDGTVGTVSFVCAETAVEDVEKEQVEENTVQDVSEKIEENAEEIEEKTSLSEAKEDLTTIGQLTEFQDQSIREVFTLPIEIEQACEELNFILADESRGETDLAFTEVLEPIQVEWFKIACQKLSDIHQVEDYLTCFNEYSTELLEKVVNSVDKNGNTALHYAVSHCNFPIVGLLLDTGVCDINLQNKAGYTAIMLAALADAQSNVDREVVRRLFESGNVNITSSTAGQTALMLTVSHGRLEMTEMLLDCKASINAQDEDGSTALMCASEHGHLEIVKLLLSHPDCDAALTDNDGSNALSIAMEAQHRDIGVLLYAHMNFHKPVSPGSIRRQRRLSDGTWVDE